MIGKTWFGPFLRKLCGAVSLQGHFVLLGVVPGWLLHTLAGPSWTGKGLLLLLQRCWFGARTFELRFYLPWAPNYRINICVKGNVVRIVQASLVLVEPKCLTLQPSGSLNVFCVSEQVTLNVVDVCVSEHLLNLIRIENIELGKKVKHFIKCVTLLLNWCCHLYGKIIQENWYNGISSELETWRWKNRSISLAIFFPGLAGLWKGAWSLTEQSLACPQKPGILQSGAETPGSSLTAACWGTPSLRSESSLGSQFLWMVLKCFLKRGFTGKGWATENYSFSSVTTLLSFFMGWGKRYPSSHNPESLKILYGLHWESKWPTCLCSWVWSILVLLEEPFAVDYLCVLQRSDEVCWSDREQTGAIAVPQF